MDETESDTVILAPEYRLARAEAAAFAADRLAELAGADPPLASGSPRQAEAASNA